MLESELAQKVMRALRQRGGLWEKRSPGPYTSTGVSDILGLYRGHWIAIELKVPRKIKEVTALQDRYLQVVADNGGLAFVATDVGGVMAQLDLIDHAIARQKTLEEPDRD